MKRAQRAPKSSTKARDPVDEMARKILKALRERRPVELPEAGRLVSRAAATGTELPGDRRAAGSETDRLT